MRTLFTVFLGPPVNVFFSSLFGYFTHVCNTFQSFSPPFPDFLLSFPLPLELFLWSSPCPNIKPSFCVWPTRFNSSFQPKCEEEVPDLSTSAHHRIQFSSPSSSEDSREVSMLTCWQAQPCRGFLQIVTVAASSWVQQLCHFRHFCAVCLRVLWYTHSFWPLFCDVPWALEVVR